MQSGFTRLNNETVPTNIIELEQIPNLPGAVARLLQMIKNHEAHLRELADFVVQDPVLVAEVLGIADSEVCGYLKVHTVKASVLTILGAQKLQSSVLSLDSTNAFKVDKDLFDYTTFWHRALCVSSFTLKINKLFKSQQPEQNDARCSTGLLHSIEHLFLATCLPNGINK
jgi:HD-like signal output (HDOD) protein